MAMRRLRHRTRAKGRSQAGFTFVELAMALFILSVGLLACSGLVIVAIRSNGKNKHESNATIMAQMLVQQFLSVSADSSPPLMVRDCDGNDKAITTNGSASGSGAALLSSGAVDFSWAAGGFGAPGGYYMFYQDCAIIGSTNYDIRWNVKTLSPYSKLVTVSARISQAAGSGGPYFALPVTIRTITGKVP